MAGVCSGPGPCDTHPTGHGGDNFVTRGGGFDPYLRAIINALKRSGHPESEAVQLAIGTVQRWARGEGNVTAATRARAAASLAHWEALKAASHALTADAARTVDLAEPRPGQRYRHGWIPIAGVGSKDGLPHLAAPAKNPMNRMTNGTQWRETPAGIIAVRGDRQIHLLGTSVAAHQQAQQMLATHSFDRLFKAGKKAPGMKNVAFHKLGGAGLGSTVRRVPSSPTTSGGTIDRVEAAARMYGTGSKQHKATAKKYGVSLTASPATTVDLAEPVFATTDGPNLTVPAGSHHYRHGWVRIDAAMPTAVERATRAAITDGHALLHGHGMVAAAQSVAERVKAAGHGVRVQRVHVAGKAHLHIRRTTR